MDVRTFLKPINIPVNAEKMFPFSRTWFITFTEMLIHNFIFLQHIEKIDILSVQKQICGGELTDQKFESLQLYVYPRYIARGYGTMCLIYKFRNSEIWLYTNLNCHFEQNQRHFPKKTNTFH